jgi:hypothetical protein
LSAKDIEKIIDPVLKKEIDEHRNKKEYDTITKAFTGEGLKAFNENRYQRKRPTKLKPPVYKVKVWYSNKETAESTLQRLYDDNEKQSVITGNNYLFLVMGKAEKRIFDTASLYDSVSIANDALKDNVDVKKKIAEDFRIKHKDKPDRVLFTLQQNELVYLPINSNDEVLRKSKTEFAEWINNVENKKVFCKRVYKVVKFSEKKCFFIPHNYANVISLAKDLSKEDMKELKKAQEAAGKKKIAKKDLNVVEFGSYADCSPYDSLHKKDKAKIQDFCIKIQIDWLGNIKIA